MARIPPLRRITSEDFKEQAEWIEPLISAINDYFEKSTSALNRSLTINDNFAGEIRTVDVDGQFPIRLAWTLSARPLAVLIGNVYRSDGVTFTPASAMQAVWSFNQAGQLQITALPGLLPAAQRFYDADVTTGTETIGIAGHGFSTGDKVTATSSGTLPAGLTSGTTYFVIRSSDNALKLATSAANAAAGTAVNITAAASGGQHLLTPEYRYKYKVTLVCLTG
jgi:hypothetical protein